MSPKPLTYRQIIERARGKGTLLHDAVIKDHILSYLLVGIATTPGLGDRLAFKGGTALRKCWFPRYRYSEDLDFTLVDGASIETDELVGLMKCAGDRAVQWVPDYGARYSFDVKNTRWDSADDFLACCPSLVLAPTVALAPLSGMVSSASSA